MSSKIGLVIAREYRTRIRNKTFLISTFLLPVTFILFVLGAAYVAVKGKTEQRVAVMDANGYFHDYLRSDAAITFRFDPAIDTANYAARDCTAILILPALEEGHPSACTLRYKKQPGLAAIEDLEQRVRSAYSDHLLFARTHITNGQLDSVRASSRFLEIRTFSDDGKSTHAESQGRAYGIAYACGILIYMLTLIYGSMVMRGVMEEKTSRVAEVIVSSVKPFPLMLGKIFGIGAVGITQFILWVIMIAGLYYVAQALLPQAMAAGDAGGGQISSASRLLIAFRSMMNGPDWALIIGSFLFYFVGGYLFYSSLFAAIGSVVNEDPQEAQSLMMPITMPIIFSFIIMSIAIQDPAGNLAFWGSMIPFSSPIVMMARIPFGVPATVPVWQMALSMALLVGGFLSTTWIAGRIYRTGILLYGKKPTWKTMWKWATR